MPQNAFARPDYIGAKDCKRFTVDLHGDNGLVLFSPSDESGDSKFFIKASYSLRSTALPGVGFAIESEETSLEVDGCGGSLSTGFWGL